MSKSGKKIYYGQFNPPVDKLLHQHFFPDKWNGVALEAGAFDGVFENNTKFFEDYYNWKTINVEPLPPVFEELTANRPNSLNLNVALSNRKGTATLHNPCIATHGNRNTWSSLTPSDLYQKSVKMETTFEVETITYNDLINQAGIDHLDLFVLDVEGHEMEVLESFHEWKIYPSVFVIETGHMTDDCKKELKELLSSKYEFKFHSFVNDFYQLK